MSSSEKSTDDVRPPYRPFGALRALLAVAVLVQHASTVSFDSPWLYGARFGSVAVIIFFALSGFIIAEAAATTYAGRPWAFIANRFMRLVPPFLFFLAMAAALMASQPGMLVEAGWRPGVHFPPFEPANLLANVLSVFPFVVFMQPLHPEVQRFEFLSVIWAVRMEFAFYFCVFAALLLPRPAMLRGRTLVLLLSVAALVLHVVFYYVVRLPFGVSYHVSFIPAFVFGVAVYLSHDGPKLFAIPLAAAAGALTLAHVPLLPLEFAGPPQLWLDRFATGSALPASIEVALAVAGMLAIALLAGAQLNRSARRYDGRLGELSYPIYLAHFPMVLMVASYEAVRAWEAMAIISVLSLAAVAIEMCLVERPLARVRSRIRGHDSFSIGGAPISTGQPA